MGTGGLIFIVQATSLPAAYAVAHFSSRIGYKGSICIGFASLPLRCIAILLVSRYAANDRLGLMATQVLDGIGAGYFGLSHTLVTRGLTDGTGRFNMALGLITSCIGAGASLSNLVGGVLADQSYTLAFLVLGVVGCLPILTVSLFVRETNSEKLAKPKKDMPVVDIKSQDVAQSQPAD